ncbi:hypothetical protein RJ639_027636 [Escallonia herrerae]|uniref:Pheromone receptor n=1 Tax=Escallonia herrerae TaxID=1293975 RepID=A0AA88X3T0_9ASTE|nr:hypothetical protein RJ639_027636 [Escallonia herrerae]
MGMEVVIPSQQSMDFDFNKARSSPVSYLNGPSTPRPFGGDYYFSAPTSPTRISELYRDFDDFLIVNGCEKIELGGVPSSAVPFQWEEKPGTPKSPKGRSNRYEDDFAFDLSGERERTSLSAEELFDGGIIRPLKPPPRLQYPDGDNQKIRAMSPRPHRSPLSQGKKMFTGSFSPRQKKDFDAAVERTAERERGRERVSTLSSSSSRHRATRSLSPLRVSEYPWEEENKQQESSKLPSASSKPPLPATTSTLSVCASSSSRGCRKWRFKDFFLFRSASEGRAVDKDPLRKYTAVFRRHDEIRNSSFRSIDSPGSGSGSSRRGPVSAHELHYTMNRAVSEDLKKKTFLPYKQGILGRLAFNPAVHAIANGFGFSRS